MRDSRQSRDVVTFRPKLVSKRSPKNTVAPRLVTVAVISRGKERRADEARPKSPRPLGVIDVRDW